MVQMPDRFFSLRTYCALGERGCDGGARIVQMPNSFSFLRTYCALRARCAVGCFGCSFFATRQRTNQENVPRATPLDPAPPWAAQLFAPSVGNFVSQGGAQRCGQVQTLRLVRHRLQDGLGWGSMLDFGRTRRRHSEKGRVGIKSFLPNGRGTSMNPCRREIFGFPDAPYATRATSAQPRKNVLIALAHALIKHIFSRGVERCEQGPAPRESKGQSPLGCFLASFFATRQRMKTTHPRTRAEGAV